MITGIDEIHEDDGDGGFYGLMGWLLYGDVDALDIEHFMGSEDMDEHSPDGGSWDVEEMYVRKVPNQNGGWRYAFTGGPGRGARKCVRVERHTFWGHWCVNHIYEPASTGVPVAQVSDPVWPMVLNGYVYLCRPCSTSFHERRDAAIKAHLAELRESA